MGSGGQLPRSHCPYLFSNLFAHGMLRYSNRVCQKHPIFNDRSTNHPEGDARAVFFSRTRDLSLSTFFKGSPRASQKLDQPKDHTKEGATTRGEGHQATNKERTPGATSPRPGTQKINKKMYRYIDI